MNPSRLRQILGLALGPLFAIAMIVLRLTDPAPVSALRHSGFDMLQQLWPRVSAPQPVRIADIDEASLRQLGQWPWPRDQLAQLVNNLKNLGAAAIVFDIVFPEKDRLSQLNADNDQTFADAVKQAPVVLAQSATRDEVPPSPKIPKYGFAQTGLDALGAPPPVLNIVSNVLPLDMAAKGLGLINIDFGGNAGVARDLALLRSDGKQFYPSLALEALRVAQGQETYVLNNSPTLANQINSVRVGALEIPTTDQGGMTIYYSRPDPALFISAAKLMAQNTGNLRSQIEGQIVLIGTSATGLLDTRVSSLGQAIPGVAVHANALQQILSGQFLRRPPWADPGEIIAVLGSAILFSLLSLRARPNALFGGLISVLILIAAITVWAFRSEALLLDATFPIAATILSFAATLGYKLLVTDAQGRSLRRAFSHYISPPLLAEIERHPNALKLGGETRDVTVLFADIKNFTPLSQRLDPQELVATVNGILSVATEAILSENGTLDKYIGDAVMAFWNAPLAVPDHQYHACLAALKIQIAVAKLNEDEQFAAPLRAKGLWPLGMRVGLASGPATVGNMGSATRFDYSVLGETVNVAARAESACKHVEADIVLAGPITEKTKSLAALDTGGLVLKGVERKVPCHAIFSADRDEHFNAAEKAFNSNEKAKNLHPLYQRFFDRLPRRREDYDA